MTEEFTHFFGLDCANIDVASIEGGIYALFEVSQGKHIEASTAT